MFEKFVLPHKVDNSPGHISILTLLHIWSFMCLSRQNVTFHSSESTMLSASRLEPPSEVASKRLVCSCQSVASTEGDLSVETHRNLSACETDANYKTGAE